MTKNNKILLGVGIAGIAAYYLWKSKKKNFSNFTTADYNLCVETEIAAWNAKVRACMTQNPTSGEEKCCVVVGGNFVNGVCNSPVNPSRACCDKAGGVWDGRSCTAPVSVPTEADCTKSGGIWDGKVCTPCADATHMVYNGVCKTDAEVKCITQQGGRWNGTTCICPAGSDLSTGICAPTTPTCKTGEILKNGVCVTIPQETPTCMADEVLVNGVCVPKPPINCPANEVLTNGVCVCPSGFHREVQVTNATEIQVCVADAPVDTPPTDTPPATGGSTTTTVTSFPPLPYLPGLPSGDSGAGGGGGGGDEEKTQEDLFDWIPWILAGMTTALSIVSEQKKQA